MLGTTSTALAVLTSLLVMQDPEPPAATAPPNDTDPTLPLSTGPLPAAARAAITYHRASAHVLSDPEYYTWGCSVIGDGDGRWHMFYSRWPRALGFFAWLTHSEIARAVAEQPEGPYRYVETVLRSRGPGHWDRTTAHNPKIKRFGDRYYLYYVSTDGDVPPGELVRVAKERPKAEWAVLRNAQRTGVASADSLTGPWIRCAAPIVQPSGTITTLTVNPAVTRGPDGTYYMIVKGDKPNETRFVRNQALATATDPAGPFTIQPEPVVDSFDSEDASMWYDESRQHFFAVYHAHTHIGLLTSAGGRHWQAQENATVAEKRVAFDDGSSWVPDRMERPFVLLDEHGVPKLLFVAAKLGDDAVNLALPLSVRTHDAATGLSWVAPGHWERRADKAMRVCTLGPTGDTDTEVFVVSLPGVAGGLVPNVNRWRAQLGQAPWTEEQVESLPEIPMLGTQARLIEVEDGAEPARALLAAVCPLVGHTLFVKMTGPASTLRNEKAHFRRFCESIAD